jgi:hypothetical protein
MMAANLAARTAVGNLSFGGGHGWNFPATRNPNEDSRARRVCPV